MLSKKVSTGGTLRVKTCFLTSFRHLSLSLFKVGFHFSRLSTRVFRLSVANFLSPNIKKQIAPLIFAPISHEIVIMHQSIPSTNIPPRGIPRVLHLLSAMVPRFVPSELPWGYPGVGPIIYYHKYQVVSWCRMKALFSFKLIYHLLLLSSYKICFKAGGKL